MGKYYKSGDGGRMTTGMIVLAVGLFLLVRKMGIFIPDWIFSWPMIFVAVGIISLAKHNFQSGFGLFMVIFGGYFLLKKELNIPHEIETFLIPAGLIALGVFLMLTKGKKDYLNWSGMNSMDYGKEQGIGGSSKTSDSSSYSDLGSAGFTTEQNDRVFSQALFCGIQKRVLSKNFIGGKVSAIFGGTEIDLTQADLGPNAVLNVEVAFGGVKLMMPANWEVKMDVTNVFAGVEDKRMYPQHSEEQPKVLRITGTVLFGGLEIKSF